jgi:hypothetical protein
MPKYHFEIIDGFRLEDPIGQDCSSDVQARHLAERMARQIAEDIQHDDSDRKVIVLNDHGDEVYNTPIDPGRDSDAPT